MSQTSAFCPQSPPYFCSASALALIVLLFSLPSQASFTKIDQYSILPNPYGIAEVGNEWYVSDPDTYAGQLEIYNSDFQPISTLTLAGGGSIWGLDYDSSTNTLFGRDFSSGKVNEYTLAGALVQSWPDPGGFADLAVDSRDNTVWIAIFGGSILHYTRAGQFIASFNTGFILTGLTIDPTDNTLLVLKNDQNNANALYEFTFSGTPLGELLPDEITENALGLHFDPTSGDLYATSQNISNFGGPGYITVFNDPTRVPEPCAGILTIGAFGGLVLRRHRIVAPINPLWSGTRREQA